MEDCCRTSDFPFFSDDSVANRCFIRKIRDVSFHYLRNYYNADRKFLLLCGIRAVRSALALDACHLFGFGLRQVHLAAGDQNPGGDQSQSADEP